MKLLDLNLIRDDSVYQRTSDDDRTNIKLAIRRRFQDMGTREECEICVRDCKVSNAIGFTCHECFDFTPRLSRPRK